jgi:hypothetical protein
MPSSRRMGERRRIDRTMASHFGPVKSTRPLETDQVITVASIPIRRCICAPRRSKRLRRNCHWDKARPSYYARAQTTKPCQGATTELRTLRFSLVDDLRIRHLAQRTAPESFNPAGRVRVPGGPPFRGRGTCATSSSKRAPSTDEQTPGCQGTYGRRTRPRNR